MISAPFLFRLGTGGIERPSRNYIPTRVWKKSQKVEDKAGYKPCIEIKVAEDHDLTISIADNGEGMTEEVKQRLFENFFTTKPVGEGTGLGMGITRDIIENKHGGKITFTIPIRR